jgi:hypothetical protein
MALPWLAILAKSIPWVELVRRAPDILESSRRLLDRNPMPAQPLQPGDQPAAGAGQRHAQLLERVAALEAREAEQAQVVAQMVAQLDGLTTGLTVLAARNRLLILIVTVLTIVVIVLSAALLLR